MCLCRALSCNGFGFSKLYDKTFCLINLYIGHRIESPSPSPESMFVVQFCITLPAPKQHLGLVPPKINGSPFDLGLLALSLVYQKLVGFISLSFTAPTCREESFHCASFLSVFWTQTLFDTGLLSLSLDSQKLVGVRFPQLHGTSM